MIWQYNVYYVCMTFGVVWYVGLILQHTSPHRTSCTHNKRYAATSPRLTFKNFKLSDLLKFSDQRGTDELPDNDLLRSKHVGVFLSVLKLTF